MGEMGEMGVKGGLKSNICISRIIFFHFFLNLILRKEKFEIRNRKCRKCRICKYCRFKINDFSVFFSLSVYSVYSVPYI